MNYYYHMACMGIICNLFIIKHLRRGARPGAVTC
jgi:hypothetical protein